MKKISRKNKIVLWSCVLSLVFIGLGLWWGHNYLNWVVESNDLGYTREARQNPFLAAELYLINSGIHAESIRGLNRMEKLPSSRDSLVVTSWRLSMGKKKIKELKDWVINGGTLITTAQAVFDYEAYTSSDILLNELGVEKYAIDSDELNEESRSDLNTTDNKETREKENRFLTPVYMSDQANPVMINVLDAYSLSDNSGKASASAANDYGTSLLQYDLGQGIITILTDISFLNNQYIDQYDHAYFLWHLTHESDKVWLIYGGSSESLLAILWRYADYLIISLTVLLFIWIWRKAVRFGPIQYSQSVSRRQLIEHIMASMHFLWRSNKINIILNNLYDDIIRKMQLRHRNYRSLRQEDQLELLHQITNLPHNELSNFMSEILLTFPNSRHVHAEARFLEKIQQIQAIRRCL